MRLNASDLAALNAATPPAPLDAFDHWQAGVDLDELPPGHFLLLPLIYHNLEAHDSAHPWLPRIRGVHNKIWYASRMAQQALLRVVTALRADGHPVLLAGAAALAQDVYPIPTLRPLFRPEFIVPVESCDRAIEILIAQGWRPDPAAPCLSSAAFRTWVCGQRFVNGQAQTIWLNWHAVPGLPCPDLDRSCWSSAAPLQFDDVSLLTLCPTHHLLRLSLANRDDRLITLVDATLLLRSTTVDWPQLVEIARRFHVGSPLLRFWNLLAETRRVEIPSESLRALRTLPTSFAERQAAEIDDQASFPQRAWRVLADYERSARCAGESHGPLSLATYLQHTRRLASRWQLPGNLLRPTLKIPPDKLKVGAAHRWHTRP